MAFFFQLFSRYALWLYVALAVIALYYLRSALVARQSRSRALFTLEREAANNRFIRSLFGMFICVVLGFGVYGLETYVFPWALEFQPPEPTLTPTIRRPTGPSPTLPVIAQSTLGPALTGTIPSPGTRTTPSRATLIPTPIWTPTPAVTPTPPPPPGPPAVCPNPDARIVSPTHNARVSGLIQVRGTARAPNFQFYKVEFGVGDSPTTWSSLSEVHREPIINGVLDFWNTALVPPGLYRLKLTIVDITGNYPPQNVCEISVFVQRQ